MNIRLNELVIFFGSKLKILRFKSFDVSDQEGRTKERYRLALWGSVANVTSAGMGLIVLIITIPMTLSYLGEERFGVWMTFTSLVTMLSFLDLGVGNGLISKVAQSSTTSHEQLRLTISRGLFLLTIIGLIVAFISGIININFPISSFLKIDSEVAKTDAVRLSWGFIALFSLSIPANGVGKALQGLQRSYWVYFLRLLGSILSLLLVIFLVEIKAEPLILLLATYGVQVTLSGSLIFILYKKKFITSKIFGGINAKKEIVQLLNTGGLFFFLQIGTMIGWGADSLILSSLAGAVAVTQFTVAQRMFQFVSLPLSIMNGPLWAAYAEAKALGDIAFIKRTLTISFISTWILATIISSAIWMTSGYLLQIWVGQELNIPSGLILAFAIWAILEATGNSFAVFLNGMHEVKLQLISVSLFCLIALPGKIYFADEYGSESVVWMTIFSYILSTVIYYVILFPNLARNHLKAKNG